MIKSGSLRWLGHLARMQEGRNAFKILTGKPRKKTFRKACAQMRGQCKNLSEINGYRDDELG